VTGCAAPRHGEPVAAEPYAYLCKPCRLGLRSDLRKLPALYARLGDALDPRHAGGSGPGSGDGLPYHDAASECRSQIRRDTGYWVRQVIEERDPAAWPVRTVGAMCGWLSGWTGWIPLRPWAGDMAAAIGEDRWRAAVITDPWPRARIPVPGGCPQCGAADGCLTAVVPHAPGDRRPALVTCSACGREWDAAQWLQLGKDIIRGHERKAAA
jgi:hypothetical protein